ncbi:DUF6273 domain-containing protein [Anaeromassilibacillus senegalensis]|uniref:DUF6273 domain-containing protein n=1 Tax=Anaeromassilibacillus senegalensis TaxID=1673717 RepID=UPI000682FCDF|nr:DUF6273 domain-containing protein [Anaeromassilibacillus senegalensis]
MAIYFPDNSGVQHEITLVAVVTSDGITREITEAWHTGSDNVNRMVYQSGPKTLGRLPIGSIVVDPDSRYNGETIRWMVGDQQSGATKLISKDILTLKCIDATEPENLDGLRRTLGNNRYTLSNIDQWLNSSAVDWYTARHTYDQPPTESRVMMGNPYQDESGFLTNLSLNLQNAMLNNTFIAVKSVIDGGGYDSLIRKVYLLSLTEVAGGTINGISEGAQWECFTDDKSRNANPTIQAVERSTYRPEGLRADKSWAWILRSIQDNDERGAGTTYVTSTGSIMNSMPNSGGHGLRPAITLSKNLLTVKNPDGTRVIQF